MASNARKQKPRREDAGRKEGLLPRKGGIDGEAVYMYAGSAIRPGAVDEAVADKVGRGRQERLKRKRETEEAEETLSKLTGGQPQLASVVRKVAIARKAGLEQRLAKPQASTAHDKMLGGTADSG